jgi:hypothetical protein
MLEFPIMTTLVEQYPFHDYRTVPDLVIPGQWRSFSNSLPETFWVNLEGGFEKLELAGQYLGSNPER